MRRLIVLLMFALSATATGAANAAVQHGLTHKVPCRDMGPGKDFHGRRILLEGSYLCDDEMDAGMDILKVEPSNMSAESDWANRICTVKVK